MEIFFFTLLIFKYKKGRFNRNDLFKLKKAIYYLFGRGSSETETFFLPFLLLAFKIFLPFLVDILNLNPCLFFLFLFEG